MLRVMLPHLQVLGSFKSFYFAYKASSVTDCPDNPWKFQNGLLFARMDAFMERCHDMLDFQSTVLQVLREQRELQGLLHSSMQAQSHPHPEP